MNKEDLQFYISADDVKEIAEKSGLKADNIRTIIRRAEKGKMMRSKAVPLIIACIERNKARAKEIINN